MAFNDSTSVEVLNQEEVERLIPLLVYLALLMLTGIPGNTLVFVIYRTNTAKSNFRFFIKWLAAIDFIMCCVVSLIIFNVAHQYTYQTEWLCKCTAFLAFWLSFISAGTLIVIGIDRYRKICKPFGRQITFKMAKQICAMIVIVAALFSFPSPFLFGIRAIQLQPFNISGTQCEVLSEFKNTIYLNLFYGFASTLFVTALSTIVILYILIGRRIIKRSRKSNSDNPISCTINTVYRVTDSGNAPNVHTDSGVGNESTIHTFSGGGIASTVSTASVGGNVTYEQIGSNFENKNNALSDTSEEIRASYEQADQTNTEDNVQTIHQVRRQRAIRILGPSEKQIKKESKAKQSVFIMFIISLMFIISYLPNLVVRLILAVDKDLLYTMSDENRAVCKGFLRSIFLNSAVNPFIYCACSPTFRHDVKSLFVGLYRRCRHFIETRAG